MVASPYDGQWEVIWLNGESATVVENDRVHFLVVILEKSLYSNHVYLHTYSTYITYIYTYMHSFFLRSKINIGVMAIIAVSAVSLYTLFGFFFG